MRAGNALGGSEKILECFLGVERQFPRRNSAQINWKISALNARFFTIFHVFWILWAVKVMDCDQKPAMSELHLEPNFPKARAA